MNYYSSQITDKMETSEMEIDIRRKLIAAQCKDFHHQFLLHVAVEVKTATTEKTIDDAKEAFTKAQRAAGTNNVIWSCAYDDELYKILISFTHITQLRHHVSVLGLKAALYAKSSLTGIIYACIVDYGLSIRSFHNYQLIIFLYPIHGFYIIRPVFLLFPNSRTAIIAILKT